MCLVFLKVLNTNIHTSTLFQYTIRIFRYYDWHQRNRNEHGCNCTSNQHVVPCRMNSRRWSIMIRSRAIPSSSVSRLEGVNRTVTCATLKCPSPTGERLLIVLRDIIFGRSNSESCIVCMHCHYVVGGGAQIPPQGRTWDLMEEVFVLISFPPFPFPSPSPPSSLPPFFFLPSSPLSLSFPFPPLPSPPLRLEVEPLKPAS